MSQALTLEVDEQVDETIRKQAEVAGTSPAQLAAARERFESHFGAVNLGMPTGADNEAIDADLARES